MDGVVYDGTSARAHPVVATIAAGGLTLVDAGGMVVALDRTVLRRQARRANTLCRSDAPDWRFVASAPLPADWLAGLSDVGALSRRALGWYGIAIAAVLAAAGGLWGFGDNLLAIAAPLVPSRVTRSIGAGVIASLDAPRCTGASGQAALDRLVARLRPAAGFVDPVDVAVIDTPAVNAVTAPGGRIAILRGLIDKAAGPDEVAGVLAHELTHVALRHPTKALIRQLGLSLIVRSFGGDVGNAVDVTALLRSSRRAERAADAGALDLLAAAHISPAGLAAFFARMRSEHAAKTTDPVRQAVDLATDFTATHPGDAERVAAIAAAVPRQGDVTPAMAGGDWQALRSICRTS